MPGVPPPAKVLVTGASGFLGTHLCQSFLARGYTVRGSVQNDAQGEFLIRKFNGAFRGKISYITVKDIAEPGACDEAVKGMDAVAHAASPFVYLEDGADPEILIRPAVKGTVGVLESIKKNAPSVKRVVVTSSVSAIDAPQQGGPPHVYTTREWNDWSVEEVKTKGGKADSYAKYCASKTLAERSFWEFIQKNKGNINFDGTTTNTPFLYGPALHQLTSLDRLNTSTKKLWDLLAGPLPEKEGELADWVGDHLDVRDIAEAQVDAVAHDKFAGHRLLMASGPITRQDILDCYHEHASELPKLPFEVPRGKPGLGNSKRDTFYRFSSEESEKLLGHGFRKLPETLKDTLWSLSDQNLLN